MADIVGLVLPFFGMIFLGALTARISKQPIEALGWMNTFILYVALPALFFQLIARTPVQQLTEWRYIAGVVLATYIIFSLMFVASLLLTRNIAESTIKGLSAAYGNIGYMGPGLALLAFGQEAAVPVALVFCFENAMHFAVAPFMMALASDEKPSPLRLALDVFKKIAFHPFIIATVVGVIAAVVEFQPPLAVSKLLDYLAQAAAPCALFAMGVTLALRPLKRVPNGTKFIGHALRPLKRVPNELGAIAVLKLIVHPLLCYVVLSLIGNFSPVWIYSAMLLAALPTATNVFVIAQQYDVWVQRASASVLVTTILSIATITTLLYLIRSGSFPPDLFP
jgi:malonate transporter